MSWSCDLEFAVSDDQWHFIAWAEVSETRPHLFGIIVVALNSMSVCCYLSVVNQAGHMISPVMFSSTM